MSCNLIVITSLYFITLIGKETSHFQKHSSIFLGKLKNNF